MGADGTRRLVLGLMGLAALWIGVYWSWPAEPPISFATTTRGAGQGLHGSLPDEALPQGAGDFAGATGSTGDAGGAGRTEASVAAGVAAPAFVEHTVAPGQTLASISQMYYGTSEHAGAIARANPLMSPLNLRSGRVIRVPRDPRNVQGTPTRGEVASDPSAGLDQEYVVRQGDSLARIARVVYGEERLAGVIFEANRGTLSSPDKIKVGQVLRIPARARTTPGSGESGNRREARGEAPAGGG